MNSIDSDWEVLNYGFDENNSSKFFKKNLGDIRDISAEKVKELFEKDVGRLVPDRQTLSIGNFAVESKDSPYAIEKIHALSKNPDLATRVMEAASQRGPIALRSYVAPDNSVFSNDLACTHTAIEKRGPNIIVRVHTSGKVKALLKDLDIVADWSQNPRTYEAEMTLRLSPKPNQDSIQITPIQNLKTLV